MDVLSVMSLLIGTIAVYIILLAMTAFGLKRQVTTELLLIVGRAAVVMTILTLAAQA